MKCFVSVLACLAAGALAGPVSRRSVETITAVLSKTQAEVDSLVATVKSFHGDVPGVIAKAETLVATIVTGTAQIQASPDLELDETIQLLPAVESLQDSGEALYKELEKRRSVIQTAGQCDETRTKLDLLTTASAQFTAALVSKVPEAAQEIALSKAVELTEVLKEAEDSFAPGKC